MQIEIHFLKHAVFTLRLKIIQLSQDTDSQVLLGGLLKTCKVLHTTENYNSPISFPAWARIISSCKIRFFLIGNNYEY